ncbi:MAG: GTP 3',8-cyclase MoaA [Pseudomonadota bacterium]
MREARFIPLKQEAPPVGAGTVQALPPASAAMHPDANGAPVLDTLQRPLHDLRISVTDRCNFRCGYCMPRSVFGPGHRFLPHQALLSFEEITRTSRLMVSMGVRKLRLTGGEPLMRKNLDQLVAMLAPLQTPDGHPVELTLTTNASLLADKAAALKAAGLHRVTISLDALNDAIFQRMNDASVSVRQVLTGIDAAQRAGLGAIKVNMVVQKGVNDDQILPMAQHFRHSGVELRFIEYMDVGATNGWRMDQVLPSEQVWQRIADHYPLRDLPAAHAGETARRATYEDGAGTVGFISSVTQAFCGDCNRLRLSTDGRLYTCLFAHQGHDLRAALRGGDDDATLLARLQALWQQRQDRYSALRSTTPDAPLPPTDQAPATPSARRIEMSYIGG